MKTLASFAAMLLGLALAICSCHDTSSSPQSKDLVSGGACELVQSGWGPSGTVPLNVEKVVTGLEVPWGMAFLPNGDWLVTERPGRIRLVSGGKLVAAPVARIATGESGEGGLLGIALHPNFASNNYFYVFYTSTDNTNRVQRYILSQDHSTATADKVILDGIVTGTFHDGGRIKFGPDGNLYVATGDARTPSLAPDPSSLNGKILRVSPDGGAPTVFASGIRNLEAFDWVDSKTLILADNGPTGELNLTGLDKVSFAQAGSNLGWPTITGCQSQPGLITPILSWQTPAPPGGGVICRGCAIPAFDGNFLIGMLGMSDPMALHLHRVVFDPVALTLTRHEVYLQGRYGRLRDVEQGPDGAIYVTTSNCDSRGTCPDDGDYILKITGK